jgi:hypothetical protein
VQWLSSVCGAENYFFKIFWHIGLLGSFIIRKKRLNCHRTEKKTLTRKFWRNLRTAKNGGGKTPKHSPVNDFQHLSFPWQPLCNPFAVMEKGETK